VTKAPHDPLAPVRRERSRRLTDELVSHRGALANLPVLDSRSADEILGYDELPR
jgi:hypothetical protein